MPWREPLGAAVVEASLDGVFVLDDRGSIASANRAAAAMLGYQLDELVGRQVASFIAPEDRNGDSTDLHSLLFAGATPLGRRVAVTGLRADGARFRAELSIVRISDGPARFAAYLREIAQQRSFSRQVEARASRQRAVTELARRAAVEGNAEQVLQLAVDAVQVLLGADSTAVVEPRFDSEAVDILASRAWPEGREKEGESRPERLAALAAGATPGGLRVLRDALIPPEWQAHDVAAATMTAIDGPRAGSSGYLITLHGAPREFDHDELEFLDAVAQVVAARFARRRLEEEIRHHAMHDSLTGLPNRTLLLDRTRHALRRGVRRQSMVAMLYIDLDRFKAINDSLGHEGGDEVLVAVAGRLRHTLRAGDTLARLGADEFAVLSEDIVNERDAVVGVERLIESLREPIVLNGRQVTVSASIGICLSRSTDLDAEALLRDADVAMYRAKERRHGGYEVFDQRMRNRVLKRIGLEQSLREALDSGAFEVQYQPVVALEAKRVVGAEALVRWNDPHRGVVPPSAFIPLAEETGMIVGIGRYVLREACRQAALWASDTALENCWVSVNISGRQLGDSALPRELAAVLAETGLQPQRLVLEVTESVLMADTASPAATLQRLKDVGVRILLDDFGTGYSSLNYVKRLPVDGIKVDRSFIAGIARNPSDRHILAAIISMGAALDVEIIAEGVEDLEQAHVLRGLGVGSVQGYRFAKPGPPAAIELLLREGLPLDDLAPAFVQVAAPAAPDTSDAHSAEPALPGGEPGATGERAPGGLVGLAEAAAALDISTSTVRRWADAGRITSIRTAGGHRRFPLEEIRQLSAMTAGRRQPVLRDVPLPADRLEELAGLLESRAESLVEVAGRSLYASERPGWFATPGSRAALADWASGVAAAARSAAWRDAMEATSQLILQSHHAGSSLAERYGFMERIGEAVVRTLQKDNAEQRVIVGTRRLFWNFMRIVLTGPGIDEG
jgi:diguanylate cyclase (GGDEF)-like protein/PAS domain S-box-containing protein/excisionase family DNA binding protein